MLSSGITFTDYYTGEVYTKRLAPFCCCIDSVARPIVQNRVQFNGYSGCSWCYHIGKYFQGSMRYPLLINDPKLRTHEEHVNSVNRVIESNVNSKKRADCGVKGKSLLLDIKHFDIVWNLPPDYMHGALMGVTKQLYSFWASNLSKLDKEALNKRMTNVKLCRDLQRSLRPLNYSAKYKALEWKIWLLFVSIPCLQNILNEKMFRSYLLFVDSRKQKSLKKNYISANISSLNLLENVKYYMV